MSVSRKDMGSVNAILTVKIGKEDYQDKVEKELKELRKKAKIPGFRPGNVP
ncbi:MAG: trigger factor family protein, partial [Bacteroidales bacterium]|nr:trigger factor family protein [Bacteroidales bacterium]